MSATASSSSGKSRVESFAKSDGSFSWNFHDVYETVPYASASSSSTTMRRAKDAVDVNGVRIKGNDEKFWTAIFSFEMLKKLDSVYFDCDTNCFRILLPSLIRLCLPLSIPCKPFNFAAEKISTEAAIQIMPMIASLVRQNRLLTLRLPCYLDVLLDVSLEVVNAIIVTDTLVSLSWMCSLGYSTNTQISEAILAALEKNVSLTEVSFYNGHSMYGGYEDVIVPLLSRNKALPSMNAAVAANQVNVQWDGSCPSGLVRQLVTAKFNIHRSFFNPSGDMCFCESCHKKSNNKTLYTRGEPPARYALPIGWMRLGLKVHEGFAANNDLFKTWHVSYHGTTADKLESIFRAGPQLLKPGDIALGGTAIGIQPGHIPKIVRRTNRYTGLEELFDINQIFTSPSIRYSSHPAYAQQFIVDHPQRSGVRIGMQFVFQCRQRPESYKIGHETVGARDTKLDVHFDNKELEWYTKENVGVVLTGLCVQLRYLSQPCTKSCSRNPCGIKI